MLDTDICSYVIRRSSEGVQQRLEAAATDVVCISVIAKAELLFDLAVSPRPERDRFAVEFFLQWIPVLDYPEAAASDYAAIRATLQQAGRMIGPNDLFMAAHARSLGLTLVTNNVREFGRVPGLQVENWALPVS